MISVSKTVLVNDDKMNEQGGFMGMGCVPRGHL